MCFAATFQNGSPTFYKFQWVLTVACIEVPSPQGSSRSWRLFVLNIFSMTLFVKPLGRYPLAKDHGKNPKVTFKSVLAKITQAIQSISYLLVRRSSSWKEEPVSKRYGNKFRLVVLLQFSTTREKGNWYRCLPTEVFFRIPISYFICLPFGSSYRSIVSILALRFLYITKWFIMLYQNTAADVSPKLQNALLAKQTLESWQNAVFRQKTIMSSQLKHTESSNSIAINH